MPDDSVTKVDAAKAPTGPQGQRYLAHGQAISMRLWDAVQPGDSSEPVRRDYETVGYVISGQAELELAGQTVVLRPGNSWIVPKGAEHSYLITQSFTAIEATHPPAESNNRDLPPTA